MIMWKKRQREDNVDGNNDDKENSFEVSYVHQQTHTATFKGIYIQRYLY